MRIAHVLAVVAVTDLDAATDFYTRVFDRAPDNNPMPSLVEWQVNAGGWVQVHADPDNAGHSQLNLAVGDLEAAVAELDARGVVAGEIVEASKDVRLSRLTDPSGNATTLIGGFRELY